MALASSATELVRLCQAARWDSTTGEETGRGNWVGEWGMAARAKRVAVSPAAFQTFSNFSRYSAASDGV